MKTLIRIILYYNEINQICESNTFYSVWMNLKKIFGNICEERISFDNEINSFPYLRFYHIVNTHAMHHTYNKDYTFESIMQHIFTNYKINEDINSYLMKTLIVSLSKLFSDDLDKKNEKHEICDDGCDIYSKITITI